MANINYTATADLKAYSYDGSTWASTRVDQNASTWDSNTGEGVLVLNPDVNFINSWAFKNCTDLLTIEIPDEIQYIYTNSNKGVFDGCTNLTSVTLSSSLTVLPNYTFRYCSSLTSIDLKNINGLGDYCFYGCSNLNNINLTNVGLGAHCFNGCSSLTTVNSQVAQTIPNYCFSSCTSLTSANFPLAISIGTGGFSTCTNLTNIDLSKVIQIDDYCFSSCTSLTDLNLSKINRIGNNAFKGCNNLTSITILKTPPTLVGSNHFTAQNISLNTLCIYSSLYQTPPWTTYINQINCKNCIRYTATADLKNISTWCINNVDQSASTWDSITGDGVLILNDNVTNIGDSAFQNVTSLTYIELPDIIGFSIGNNAFNGCNNLKLVSSLSLTPPQIGSNNFTAIDKILCVYQDSLSLYQNDSNWNSVFENIRPLLNIQYTANSELSLSTYLSKAYLSGNYNSTTKEGEFTVIGKYYDTLPEYILSYQTNLTSVILPEGLINTGKSILYNCTNLLSVSLPDSLITIDNQAFQDCSSITSVILPESLTTIGSYAFQSCSNLSTVTISESLTNIGYMGFRMCNNLTEIIFPESLTVIGSYAFENCSNLTTIYWNAINITSMGTLPFRYDNKLNTIIFGDSVTNIPDLAFQNCSSITSVILPESLTTIGNYAFQGCIGLTEIVLPNSLTYIEGYAFGGCTNLLSVTSLATTPPTLESNNFTASGDTLYTPIASKSAYQSASNWSTAFTYYKGLCEISTSAGENGTITPTTEVLEGESFTVTATPNAHYKVSHFVVDGVDVGTIDNYTFQNLNTDHIIYVDFEHITHTITATAYEGGAIVPSGVITVNEGENQSFDIVPLEGYGILALFIDGTQIEPVETYTFENVTTDHTIQAMFYPLRVAGFNTQEMLDINYLLQDYLEQLKKRD